MTRRTERLTYGSLGEMATHAAQLYRDDPTVKRHVDENGAHWSSLGLTAEETFALARDGWTDQHGTIADLADGAIAKVEQAVTFTTFRAYHDVTGGEVDVARHLAGVPESMLEYEPLAISRAGRVVSVVASISVSGSISAENLLRRGAAVAALVVALERLGHEVEVYADLHGTTGTADGTVRTLVKSTHDLLDVDRLAFALAHPGMLRRLTFAVMHAFRPDVRSGLGVGGGYGAPTDPIEDLPDGTIYLPCLKSAHDVPDPERFVIDHLRDLGLIGTEA